MSLPDDRLLDNQIRCSVASSVPTPVERRLRAQLADFRTRLAAKTPDATRHPPRWVRSAAWWGLGATCAAAATVVTVGLLVRPKSSFAEVTNAVLEQSWVHTKTIYPDQSTLEESWFSAAREISASRTPESITYEDHRLRVYYTYNPGEQVLYRSPDVSRSGANRSDSMAEVMSVLLQGGHPPVALLHFLGPDRDRLKVLDQSVEKITEKSRTWLDYHLTFNQPGDAQPVRMMFRVDPDTKLPQVRRVEVELNGKLTKVETRFDYPDRGPADIYELGVPRTSKLVDRVPTGDLKLIWETIRAGRERMDSYRATFVSRLEGMDHHWWTERPLILYRKGNQFRADYDAGWIGNPTPVNRPADGEDLGKWWVERAKLFRHYPLYVLRDSTFFTSNLKTVTDRDGSQHQEIESVTKYTDNTIAGETFPVEYAMRPEFVCRPPMGLGNTDQEATLDMHPADGPAGCILLTVGHTKKDGRVNEKGIGIPDGNRYWLDPQRDFIAMRWDMVMRDQTGKETIINNHTVEETARSPQGVWYATKVRLKNAAGEKRQFDKISHIYVDFNVDLPDSLFEPPTPGRIR
jgi:hypothetical protein